MRIQLFELARFHIAGSSSNSPLEQVRSMRSALFVLLVALVLLRADATFNYHTFGDRSYLNLVGGAHRMGPTLALTADDRASAGALWFHKQIDISDGFLTNFLVAQSDFKAAGEEGFAFVMHRDDLKRTIGSGGSDFGFGGIRDAVAVVFDTRGGEENALAPVAHITILNGIGSELRWDSASNVTLGSVQISLEASRRSDMIIHAPNLPGGVNAPKPVVPKSGTAVTAAPTADALTSEAPLLTNFMVVVHDGMLLVYITNQSPFPVLSVRLPPAFAASKKIGVGFTGSKQTGMVRLLNWFFKPSSSVSAPCEPGFVGEQCTMDPEPSLKICPALDSCKACARSARDCGWCTLSNRCEPVAHAESACYGAPLNSHMESCGTDTAARETVVWSIALSVILMGFVVGLFGRLLFHPLAETSDCLNGGGSGDSVKHHSMMRALAQAAADQKRREAETNDPDSMSVAMVPLGASMRKDGVSDSTTHQIAAAGQAAAKKEKKGIKNALKAHVAKQLEQQEQEQTRTLTESSYRLSAFQMSPYYQFRLNGERLPRMYVGSCIMFSLCAGAMYALIISFIVNCSMVEITEQPIFAIGYGVLFIVLGLVVFGQALSFLSNRGFSCKDSIVHLTTLFTIGIVMFTAGVMCFALEKDWAIDMSTNVKLVMYGLLGVTLCLTSAFATADLLVRVPRVLALYETEAVVYNASHVRMIGLFALMAGIYYAFVFALADMSEAKRRRIELALQIEAYYSYPLSALLGAVTAMLYEVLRLRDEHDQLKRSTQIAANQSTSDDALERGAMFDEDDERTGVLRGRRF